MLVDGGIILLFKNKCLLQSMVTTYNEVYNSCTLVYWLFQTINNSTNDENSHNR